MTNLPVQLGVFLNYQACTQALQLMMSYAYVQAIVVPFQVFFWVCLVP